MVKKVNNKKAIMLYFYGYIIAFTFIVALSVIVVLFKLPTVFFVVSVTIKLYLLLKMYNLRFFEYEDSGYVITIKYYSVISSFRGIIIPAIEVPKLMIESKSYLKSDFFAQLTFKITFHTSNGKIISRYFFIKGINRNQFEREILKNQNN